MTPVSTSTDRGGPSPTPVSNRAAAAPRPTPGDSCPPAAGCYLISYVPGLDPYTAFDGTLRVDSSTGRVWASGDLYQRPLSDLGELAPPPEPAAVIPVFPIDRYAFYLLVTAVAGRDDGFGLAFEAFRFLKGGEAPFDGRTTQWPSDGTFGATMTPAPAPPGYPSPEHYYEGDVANEAGTVVGRLSMGLVSPYLRKATIEIDRVAESETPLGNGFGVTWKTIFDKLGWDVTLSVSDNNVKEPPGGAWRGDDAHKALGAWRDRSDLDAEWLYHILAVRTIDYPDGDRGVMYDNLAVQNEFPREGLMVASHWSFPEADPWGLVKGLRAGTTVTFFRTAVHELGHAMGLDHNDVGNHFMASTLAVAENAAGTPATPFPTNIEWSYSREDEHRLRHWPDPVVRPGANQMWAGRTAPLHALASDGHRLDVAPVAGAVPLGDPVGVTLRLVNTSGRRQLRPASLGLEGGGVRGQVVGPAGNVRTFAPVVLVKPVGAKQVLEPGQYVDGSLSLSQGAEGRLFPVAGEYRISVEVSWVTYGLVMFSLGETSITVTPAAPAGDRKQP